MLFVKKSMSIAPVLLVFAIVTSIGLSENEATVRVMRHHDGSQTVSRHYPGNHELVKKKIGANGTLQLSSHYRLDEKGNPQSGKVYDAQGKLLYKISFAFSVQTGRLVAERMFDANQKDSKTGLPLLVSETRYNYDAHGKRSKPVTRTFVKGLTAAQHFEHQ